MPETEKSIEEDIPTLTDGVETKPSIAAVAPVKKKLGGIFNSSDRAKGKISSINLSWSTKAAYPLAILFIILILCWFMYFLYNNVYQTIAMGQNITNLKALVINQNLNEADFNKILELTKNKNAGASWRADNINNPFIFAVRVKTGPAAPASSTAVTSTASAAAAASSTAATSTKK